MADTLGEVRDGCKRALKHRMRVRVPPPPSAEWRKALRRRGSGKDEPRTSKPLVGSRGRRPPLLLTTQGNGRCHGLAGNRLDSEGRLFDCRVKDGAATWTTPRTFHHKAGVKVLIGPRHYAGIAQLAERLPRKQLVRGSSPCPSLAAPGRRTKAACANKGIWIDPCRRLPLCLPVLRTGESDPVIDGTMFSEAGVGLCEGKWLPTRLPAPTPFEPGRTERMPWHLGVSWPGRPMASEARRRYTSQPSAHRLPPSFTRRLTCP